MSIAYECLMSFLASLCFGIIFQVRGIKLFTAGFGGLMADLFGERTLVLIQ